MPAPATLAALRAFVAERDWDQFHTPENLAKSVSIEAFLTLAAGAGLAGAAAITSALAAFGPGGMIGGLLTAGALVTAGGGGSRTASRAPGQHPKRSRRWLPAK